MNLVNESCHLYVPKISRRIIVSLVCPYSYIVKSAFLGSYSKSIVNDEIFFPSSALLMEVLFKWRKMHFIGCMYSHFTIKRRLPRCISPWFYFSPYRYLFRLAVTRKSENTSIILYCTVISCQTIWAINKQIHKQINTNISRLGCEVTDMTIVVIYIYSHISKLCRGPILFFTKLKLMIACQSNERNLQLAAIILPTW